MMVFAGAFLRSDFVCLTCGEVTVYRLDGSKCGCGGPNPPAKVPGRVNRNACASCRSLRVSAAFMYRHGGKRYLEQSIVSTDPLLP
jgi:hypothetical protein